MNGRSDDAIERLTTSAKLVLDNSVDDLDPATRIRLQQARQRALEGTARRRAWLVWASGAVLASAALIVLTLGRAPHLTENHGHVPLLEDLELVTSPENVDISEDLEFYDWLADGVSTTG